MAAGTHCTAFDTNGYLPNLYKKYGYRAIARVAFDPAQAPEGWKKEMGTPDVVVMVRDPDRVVDAPVLIGDYKYQKNKIPLVSYEKAVEMQKAAVATVESSYKDVTVSRPVPAETEGKGWAWHYLERRRNPVARMMTSPEPNNRIAVRLLETMPDERGRGYGSKLLEHAKEYAKEKGADQLISDPEGGTTEAAGRLWEKIGAEKIPYKGAKEGTVWKLDLKESAGEAGQTEKEWLREFQQQQKSFEKDTGKLGLRHDAVLTGERTPVQHLTEHVWVIGKMQREQMKVRGTPDMKYGGPQDFVRSEGKVYDVPDAPPQIKLMTPKECYANSTHMMLDDPKKYDYAEGYYVSPHLPYPIEHAWLIDKENGNTVVDPTLGWQPKAQYIGVAYPKTFVEKKMLQNKYYGVMSNGLTANDVVLGTDKDFKYAKSRSA